MKGFFVFATIFIITSFSPGEDRVEEVAPFRILLLPFTVDPQVEDPWEGLAPVLALQSRASSDRRLVPFTACRRKLNEYGMSVVLPTSMATRIKLARDLDADLLVSGHLEKDRLIMLIYDASQRSLERRVLREEDRSQYLVKMAGILNLSPLPLMTRQYDLYRVWASIYFLEELESARPTADRILEHDLTGWLFMQEYLDLFGDPSRNLKEAADLAWWRDLFLKKQHHARALALSEMTMAARHNPRDLIAHARILLAQDDEAQACIFLKNAESFGFIDDDLRQTLSHCTQPPSQEVKTELQ